MPNDNSADRIWQEWIKRADDDELNIKSILKHRDGTANIVGVLSQQMAEKYLKGLLVFHKQKYPRIHDLVRIATLLESMAPKIIELNNEKLDELSKLYTIDRYPGEMPDLTWEEAKEAYAAANKVKEFALKEFSKKP